MDKQTESREQFEAEFKRRHSFVPEASMAMMLEQYNFGTEEEPDLGYYSLAARDAWEWWQKSRESIVVDIDWPEANDDHWKDGEEGAYAQGYEVGKDLTAIKVRQALQAIGIRIKGEGDGASS